MEALLRWDAASMEAGSERFNSNQLLDQQSHMYDRDDRSGDGSLKRRELRVLVVDDDRDTSAGLALLVRRWGHAVRVANDGVSAVRIAAEQRPDVLLLDIGMPGMDGFEVARKLRREVSREECFLIAITGWADEEHRRECFEAGIDLVLIKPADPSVVETLLMLEAARLDRPRGSDRRSLSANAFAWIAVRPRAAALSLVASAPCERPLC